MSPFNRLPRVCSHLGGLWITLWISACASPRLQGTHSPSVTAEQHRVLSAIERFAVPTAELFHRSNAAILDPWHTYAFDVQTLPYLADSDDVARASGWLQRKKPNTARDALANASSPSAAWLRAVTWREEGQIHRATKALRDARHDPVLQPWVLLEEGRIALAQGRAKDAAQVLIRVFESASAARDEAVMPLIAALQVADPEELERRAEALEKRLPKRDPDARSIFLHARAMAFAARGKQSQASAMLLRQYIEEPVSVRTPAQLPPTIAVTVAQAMIRAHTLLEAHRNEDAIRAWEQINDTTLTTTQRCDKAFDLGMAHRKLRHYTDALPYFEQVILRCAGNPDLVRRTRYVHIKVISIRDGLEAIPLIDTFAARYKGHSMVDDVLFWAGDLYQQRHMEADAKRYYARASAITPPGDYCGEARWRMAWMDYRQERWDDAEKTLRMLIPRDACVRDEADRARAAYWLGRVHQQRHETQEAVKAFHHAITISPLGFYGQLAISRLRDVGASAHIPAYPAEDATISEGIPLCARSWIDQPPFWRGLALLIRGLGPQAAKEFLSLDTSEQSVLASTHAAALGEDAQPAISRSRSRAGLEQCGPLQSKLLLALLLDHAGAHRDAHWRIRTDFANALNRMPTARDRFLLKAAYPLAFRHEIAAAETESGVPSMFLQALAREESAFDPYVVSWAGAYGLTQLLFSSGQTAARVLQSPELLHTTEDLLDPTLNARLGGALLGFLLRENGDNPALALTGYNAGGTVAHMLRKRLHDQPLDVYAESVTIQETRGYVQRVLRTYGLYRWLYNGDVLMLPANERIPKP